MRIWSFFRASGGAAGRVSARAVPSVHARPGTRWTTDCCSRPMPRPRRWPRSRRRPAWMSFRSPRRRRAAIRRRRSARPTASTASHSRAAPSPATARGRRSPSSTPTPTRTSPSDLAAFDAEYGLAAPPSFTVDNLGATTTDAGWALETALDVEWAHAIAPDANIVLVEASSASLPALFGAVSYASNLSGVGVISMSWGASEFSSETNYDTLFHDALGPHQHHLRRRLRRFGGAGPA